MEKFPGRQRVQITFRMISAVLLFISVLTIGLPASASWLVIVSPAYNTQYTSGQPLSLEIGVLTAESFDKIEVSWWYETETLSACKAAGNCRYGKKTLLYADGLQETGVVYFQEELSYFVNAPHGTWRIQATLIKGDLALLTTNSVVFDVVPGSIDHLPDNIGPVEIHGPDLQVTDFELDILPAGQKDMEGNTYSEMRYYFVWTVRNMGDKIATVSKFKVTSQVLSGSATGAGHLAYTADIKQLWPNPNQISGAQKIWNTEPFAAPESPVTFRFRATADHLGDVKEKNEANNVLVKDVTVPQLMFSTPPPGVLKKELTFQQETQGLDSLKPVIISYPSQGQVFTVPANITPRVQGGGKVRYTLKKKVNGRWVAQKPVATPKLQITDPGFYCLVADPESKTAAASKCVPFEVKARRTGLQPKAVPKTAPLVETPVQSEKPLIDSDKLRRTTDSQ